MTAFGKERSGRIRDYLFTLVMFLFFIFVTACNTSPGIKTDETKKSVTAPVSSTIVRTGPPEAVSAADVQADSVQSMLKGKWLRSDGTYTIEIFSVKEDGKMDAGYFNPNPINVGSSAWMISQGNILIEIVMRDANYPGSKYNLIYDRQNDLLRGNYFQAVQGINYDVVFTRNK
jgi:hypothetical protein